MKTDILFENARIYNVFIRKWITADVAVINEKILYVGDAGSQGITSDAVVDCEGRPLIPGMIDIHLHIESSLCVPSVFSDAVLRRGVTTVVAEPHEIVNVFGASGMEEMIRVSKGTELDIFYGIPSSVPSTSSDLETTGGIIGVTEAMTLFKRWPEVICLGEVMNYGTLIENFSSLVTSKKKTTIKEIIDYMRIYHPLAAVEGHCPSVRDLDLAKLLYLGIDSDHCLQDLEGMKQRFLNGMFVELQEKSLSPELISYLSTRDLEHLYSFVTDDVPPDILEEKGHLDYLIKKVLRMGLPFEKAVTASSWSPACRMGFRDRGSISPGKLADFILLEDDSPEFIIRDVYKKGVLQSGEKTDSNTVRFSSKFMNSIKLDANQVNDSMFTLKTGEDSNSRVRCRVMVKNLKNTYTTEEIRSFPVIDRIIPWEDSRNEVNLAVVVNRYSKEARFAQGLLGGEKLTGGAFCSSHAHDHHNLLVLGDNSRDMRKALEWVIEKGGGMCVVSGGDLIAALSLPVGGIISESPMPELARLTGEVQKALRCLGMKHPNPIMSLCTLTLPVSPELKITDLGLVNVRESRRMDLIL